jgi:hypothetical protein
VLDITINKAADSLAVKEQITGFNSGSQDWQEIILSCPPAYYPELFKLKECILTTSQGTEIIQPDIRDSMLVFKLPHLVGSAQKFFISLDYDLSLPPIDPNGLPPVGNFGRGEKIIQAGDFYATLTPYLPGQGFKQWKYAPVGDPVIYSLSDYQVTIRAPQELKIAAAGFKISQAGTWTFALQKVKSFAFLASKDYRICEAQILGIPIKSYYLKGFERAGKDALLVAKRSLALFSEIYGPYPYDELVIAQNAYLGAMEYSSFCSESNAAYQNYRGESRSFLIYVVAHEIAHQWWYGAVGNDQVIEPWLDEALATFSEYLYYQKYHPEDLAWWWEIKVIQRDPHGYLDATIYEYPSTKLYIKNVYGLAAKFMVELYSLVGDQSFRSFILDYREQYENKFATKQDFFAILKKHTKEDLTPLKRYFKEPF